MKINFFNETKNDTIEYQKIIARVFKKIKSKNLAFTY